MREGRALLIPRRRRRARKKAEGLLRGPPAPSPHAFTPNAAGKRGPSQKALPTAPTWIRSGSPSVSMRDAVFMVSPKSWKRRLEARMTPPVMGPEFSPMRSCSPGTPVCSRIWTMASCMSSARSAICSAWLSDS